MCLGAPVLHDFRQHGAPVLIRCHVLPVSHLSTSFFNNNMDPAHEPADDA